MEKLTDQVEKNSNILEAEFGGEGARQVLGAVMKDVEHYSQVIIIGLKDNQETEIWASAMTPAELALMTARLSGYAAIEINGWGE